MSAAALILNNPRTAGALIDKRQLTVIIFICWLLSAVCFQTGAGESIGLYAAIKASTRVLSLLLLGWMLMRDWHWVESSPVVWRLTPLAVFAGWTITSTLWSPLRSVTLTHGMETMMLTLLAMAVGLVCRGEDDISWLLLNLVIIVCMVCAVVMGVNYPVIMVGLRPNLLMQPNNIAAVASIGLITATAARILWNWRWTRILFLPSMLICGATMVIARSRSCIMVTAVVLLPLLFWLYRGRLVAAILLVFGCLAAAWPYSETVAHLPETLTGYMLRGQTAEDMYTVSGRTELWSIALDSFQEAPFLGHGYYVMTSTGSMRVWGAERWQTAHNTYLHMITGTGLAGSALLCWALTFTLGPVVRALIEQRLRPKVNQLIILIVAWCLTLGFFELSFAGPVDPMVLTFFVMLGLAAGQAPTNINAHPARS